MATYSIKELSLLSGIKAHTIRIWEKRYNMFSPDRTDTNIRRYSDDALRLSLNIVLLQNMGFKISRIAKLNSDEISDMVSKGSHYASPTPVPESLFMHALNLDQEQFSLIIQNTIAEKGIEWTFENMIVPFQKRIGLLWQAGTISPAQEHFSSNILRNVLIASSLQLKPLKQRSENILFFLPEGELHELGLLYFNYIARKEGFQTVYLGQNVPTNDVLEVAEKQNVTHLFTSITLAMFNDTLSDLFKHLSNKLNGIPILATGHLIQASNMKMPSNVYKIANAQQFRNSLGLK